MWIAELGELTALDRSESEQAKQFISQVEDWFRPAYGRRTEQYPRRCVFFGTSNQDSYLRDSTGNRRYWPVDTNVLPIRHPVFTDFTQAVVDQVWAEAVVRYQAGESLYLDGHAAETAVAIQEEHRETDAWEGAVRDFLGPGRAFRLGAVGCGAPDCLVGRNDPGQGPDRNAAADADLCGGDRHRAAEAGSQQDVQAGSEADRRYSVGQHQAGAKDLKRFAAAPTGPKESGSALQAARCNQQNPPVTNHAFLHGTTSIFPVT